MSQIVLNLIPPFKADAGTDIRVEKRPITGPKPQVQEPVTYGTLTSKRQLDRYRKDRCWSTCRWLLMLLILLICLSLLLFAIYFSYLTPRCNKVDSAWWKNSVVYEVRFKQAILNNYRFRFGHPHFGIQTLMDMETLLELRRN